MSTESTPQVYLSNFLFWQSYHGWVTFRFPVFPLSCSKLFWYENKQLYIYLPLTVSFLSSGSLQRFLKYLLTCYLLVLLSGGGISFVFVFVFL